MPRLRRKPPKRRSKNSRVRRIGLPLAAALLLAGCGPNDTDPGPGGVTVGEARALDEAAEMLDEQRLPAEALPPTEPNATRAPEPVETPEQEPAG
jgi:hypothetical protein